MNEHNDTPSLGDEMANREQFESVLRSTLYCDLCEGICDHPIFELLPWVELDRLFNLWNATLEYTRQSTGTTESQTAEKAIREFVRDVYSAWANDSSWQVGCSPDLEGITKKVAKERGIDLDAEKL